GVGSAAHEQGHVVQQEAHTVVAQTQHHIVHTSGSGAVDDALQAVHGEVLPASVQHDKGRVILVERGVAVDVALGSLRQSGAKGGDDVSHFFCHAGIGLSLGHVAPDAEHGAHGVLDGAAHEAVDVKLAGLVGGALVAAHDPIPVAVGVHQLVALLSQEGGLGHVIAPPTGGPIADDDVLVEGALIGGVVVVDAVVEGHGSHAGLLDHGGHLIDVLNKVVVLAIGYQLGEAHAAGIVGVLVHTHVEEGAALAGEVGDVLLEERLGEAGSGLVGDVNGALRGAIGAVHTSEGLGSVQNRVHVAGGVDQRHDLHALSGGVGQDLVHLG